MGLDHLAAASPLGAPLDEAQRERALRVLRQFGFVPSGRAHVLDATYPWVHVEDDDGLLRVHVRPGLPEHLVAPALAALDGLVMEAGLVRIDPLARREIAASEWARRCSEALASRRSRP